MDLDTLRLFTQVAHKLSFAAVADERGVNPSSVSRAISQLEDELGVRLFQRTTRRMTLTESGSLFYRRVMDILDEFDLAQEQARAVNAGPRGRLRLTASTAFGERLLMPLIPAFRARYPDVKLDLLFSDANLDLIADNIDLAIRLGTPTEADVVASRLFQTRYRVCASPDYLASAAPLATPQDLQAHRCVRFALPAFRSAWRFRRRGGQQLSVPVDGDLIISSALSLRTAVLAAAGPALLADWLIRDDLAAGRLIDLFPDYAVTATDFDTAAWFIYPSRAYLPQKVRVAIDFFRAKLAGPQA